jgi:hypothetical protein
MVVLGIHAFRSANRHSPNGPFYSTFVALTFKKLALFAVLVLARLLNRYRGVAMLWLKQLFVCFELAMLKQYRGTLAGIPLLYSHMSNAKHGKFTTI